MMIAHRFIGGVASPPRVFVPEGRSITLDRKCRSNFPVRLVEAEASTDMRPKPHFIPCLCPYTRDTQICGTQKKFICFILSILFILSKNIRIVNE